MSTQNLADLVGKPLTGFEIAVMTEVFHVDLDGRKDRSLGFFKSWDIAVSFAESQVDANWYKTETAFVLTNGIVGYVIGQSEPVNLFDDEAETLKLREKIIAKLSKAERVIMGIKS